MSKRPEDYSEEHDYEISDPSGGVSGWMRARFAEASCPIEIARPSDDASPAEWTTTGRQVADFCHDSDAAAREFFGLRAEGSDDSWSVVDPEGGVWWPSDEAADEIAAAQDSAAMAVRICTEQPMRGDWRD